jgi:hypothetical protein
MALALLGGAAPAPAAAQTHSVDPATAPTRFANPVTAPGIALSFSACPTRMDAEVRRILALDSGSARVLVSCNGPVARIDAVAAGDFGAAPAPSAARSIAMDKFPQDAVGRAVALAVGEAVATVERQQRADRANAIAAYQQGFVWFYDSVSLAWFGRRWKPYLGKYRGDLDGADFYRAVDRPDLAASYYRRRTLQVFTVVAGVAASLYGMGKLQSDRSTAELFFFGGLAAYSVGIYLPIDPANESEARQLADAHNHALKARLGLGTRIEF